MPFLILFIIPALVGMIAFRFSSGITPKEFALQMVAQAVVAGLSVWAIYSANTSDTEVLNGVVVSKRKVRVHCEHSYKCHCHTVCSGTGKKRSCHEKCSICYEHPFDYEWQVYSSIDRSSEIDRVDRQGLDEPPRWTVARVGEPYSAEHGYTNYLKAAPGSLFRRQGLAEKYEGNLPDFPAQVTDYYRYQPLVLVNGARVDSVGVWNQGLAEMNGRLGSRKQVDIVLVLVRDLPQEYFYALEQVWIGGKQNSVVLVIGVNAALMPQWATVMSWTTNEMLKVFLRDVVMDIPVLDREVLFRRLEQSVNDYYQRKPMSDFEYLASSIAPTPTQWGISMVVGLLVCIGLSWVMHRYDVFGDEDFGRF